MRVGRWTRAIDHGEGSAAAPGFPPMPDWFRDNRDFGRIAEGLAATGPGADEIAGIMGGNWLKFFENGFGAAAAPARGVTGALKPATERTTERAAQ